MEATSEPVHLIKVGRFSRAWGVSGWLLVKPYADVGLTVLRTCHRWYLSGKGGQSLLGVKQGFVVAREVLQHGATCLRARLSEVVSREQAEALSGEEISVPRCDFPEPEADTYYWTDLEGCRVFAPEGELLGSVSYVADYGAGPILHLDAPSAKGGERLIPFVDAWVRRVDISRKVIYVDWQPDF